MSDGMALAHNSGTPMKPKITRGSLARAKPVTAEEMEAVLLRRLRCRLGARQLRETLWNLALVYQRAEEWELAEAVVEIVLRQSADKEDKARCLLVLGQLAECRRDPAEAMRRYREGLGLEPQAPEIAYLLHNNLGYCLYLQGSMGDAALHFRRAIALDPRRSNAWCNLGLTLEAQGDLAGSASAHAEAIKADPGDRRAALCAERLLGRHPHLRFRFAAALEQGGGDLKAAAQSRARRTLH